MKESVFLLFGFWEFVLSWVFHNWVFQSTTYNWCSGVPIASRKRSWIEKYLWGAVQSCFSYFKTGEKLSLDWVNSIFPTSHLWRVPSSPSHHSTIYFQLADESSGFRYPEWRLEAPSHLLWLSSPMWRTRSVSAPIRLLIEDYRLEGPRILPKWSNGQQSANFPSKSVRNAHLRLLHRCCLWRVFRWRSSSFLLVQHLQIFDHLLEAARWHSGTS